MIEVLNLTDEIMDKLYGNEIYEKISREYIVNKRIASNNNINTCISLAEVVMN